MKKNSLETENISVMTIRRPEKNCQKERKKEIGYLFFQDQLRNFPDLPTTQEVRFPIYHASEFEKQLEMAEGMADNNDIYVMYEKPPTKDENEDLNERNNGEYCHCIRRDGKFVDVDKEWN